MITSFFLYLAGVMFTMIGTFLSLITISLPIAIVDSFTYVVSNFWILGGFLNVYHLLSAITFVLAFKAGLFLVKVILFLYALIPFFGKTVDLPVGKNYVGSNMGGVSVSRSRLFKRQIVKQK